MGNRKAFIDTVVPQFKLIPSTIDNAGLLKEWLEGLTDKEFEQLVVDLETGKTHLSFIVDNFDVKFTRGKLLEISDKIGAPAYSTVIEYDETTGLTHESNEKHWATYMPKRRQIQDVDDKRSMAYDSNTRDLLTGQVTGDSKGSAVSAGQYNAISGRNCPVTATEFARMRGGDITAGAVFTKQLVETGHVSAEAVAKINSMATVNQSVASYLNTIHIQNNINVKG